MTVEQDGYHAECLLVQETEQDSTMTLMLVSSQALVGRGQLRKPCRHSPLDWSVWPLLVLHARLDSVRQLGRDCLCAKLCSAPTS